MKYLKRLLKWSARLQVLCLKRPADDVAGFQYYTIRNLDNKLSTQSDIEQYKLLSIKEDPLDNRQKHLDVMCFPVLFPDGIFGKYHPREVKVSDSEYVKTHLLNKDSQRGLFLFSHFAVCTLQGRSVSS